MAEKRQALDEELLGEVNGGNFQYCGNLNQGTIQLFHFADAEHTQIVYDSDPIAYTDMTALRSFVSEKRSQGLTDAEIFNMLPGQSFMAGPPQGFVG